MNMVASLPDKQKAEFMRHLETAQIKDSLLMYNRVVEKCFDECVKSFRSKKLEDKEDSCVSHCADKFLKHSQRVGVRFAEYQQENQG